MAKDLVRTRRYIKKMIMMKTQVQAVSLKIQVCGLEGMILLAGFHSRSRYFQTLKSQNAMAQAMKGVTKVSDGVLHLCWVGMMLYSWE